MKRQPILRSDWWALALVCALFLVWFFTGYAPLRYIVLAAAFLYLFVVRIVVLNRKNK